MKKYYAVKKCIAMLSAIGMLCLPQAVWADDGLNISYSGADKKITLSADICEKENQAVVIKIASDAENTLVTAIRSGEGGAVLHSETMPASFSGGRYDITVSSLDKTVTGYFIYPIEADIESVLPILNGAESDSELTGLMKANADPLAIDMLIFEPIADKAGKIFFSMMPADGLKTATEFLEGYNNSLAAVGLSGGEKADTVLAKYGAAIGVEASIYASLADDEKSALDSYILNADYTKRTVKAVIYDGKAASQIKVADSWSELKAKIEENSETLNLDTEYFDKVDLKDSVYQEMYSNLSGEEDIEEIREIFYEASKTCYEEENEPVTKPAKGSGGGGGGAKVSVSLGNNANVGSSSPAGSTDTKKSFSDTENHWGKDYIAELAEKGIINGFDDGTFKPDISVTRAEFVTMVVKALGLETVDADESFSDVKKDSWFFAAVMTANKNGLVNGVADGMFSPDSKISRQDAFVILSRAFKDSLKAGEASDFADNENISEYAKEAAELLSASGIVSGNEKNELRPKDETSRAEVAALISRILALGKE